MEHPTSNKNISAIKEVRRLFNVLMSLKVIFLVLKQRELEENFTKKKLLVIFLKKEKMVIL